MKRGIPSPLGDREDAKSSQPSEQPVISAHQSTPPDSPRDLLGALLKLAQEARSAPSEAEVLRAAAVCLLHYFQAGRVELKLVGSSSGVVATSTADGSISLLPLALTSGESLAPIAEVESPALAGQHRESSALAYTALAALLQDDGETLGSLVLTEPRGAGQFTAEQRLLLSLVAEYIAMLLRDRRLREQAGALALAEERSRLARELHDTVAQSLVALVLRLERIEEPRGELAEARLLARRALEDARRAIWGLRPALLETLPFHEALAREVEHVADEGGLSSRVTVVGTPRPLLPQQEMALFRIAQEALSNAIRHAAAHRVRADLSYLDDGARLIIEDDGRGFDPASLPAPEPPTAPTRWLPYFDEPGFSTAYDEAGHFGLQTMRERARLVGGWLTLESAPGQGTRVIVNLPYAPLAGVLLPAAEQEAKGDALRGEEPDQPHAALPPARQAPATLPSRTTPAALPGASSGRIRILVADDHAVIRAGMRRLLESYPDFEVVGEAADGLEALAEAQDLGPQVILMDMRMPGMNGLEALRQLRASNPDLRILMISAYEEDEDVLESLKAGASGYVLKDMAPDELAQAIRAVAQGETLLAPGLTGKLVDRLGRPPQADASSLLTARESEALRALAGGLRNKEIARQLQVSERTVTFHLAHIYQKLGVNSRTEALSRALELGLLKL
ncbi:MAG TPA: hybrid sensor histidine kinase/response regulator transcription factor [Ktedonobacterales bacterium]|nr:hybrid sensor histidine kinase/response regulator transcription factor [Ktedonobacterales bacterium]